MATLPFLGAALRAAAASAWASSSTGATPRRWPTTRCSPHKQPYLNVPFFLVRTVVYFAVWSGLALWFGRAVAPPGRDRRPRAHPRGCGGRARPALILFALTVTFAAFDWLMSLDPHWYSTIFGVYFFAGCWSWPSSPSWRWWRSPQRRAGLLVERRHRRAPARHRQAAVRLRRLLGLHRLLPVLPDLVRQHARRRPASSPQRLAGSWRPPSIAARRRPFRACRSSSCCRARSSATPRRSRPAPLWLLAMHLLDLYWLVMPSLHPDGMRPEPARRRGR